MNKTHINTADRESDCSSYSNYPEFRNYIDQTNSQLFYARLEIGKGLIFDPSSQKRDDNLFRNEYKRMSLRRDRGILSRFTESKKKSPFQWKIVNRSRQEQFDGVFKELQLSVSAKKKGKTETKTNQKVKENLFEKFFDVVLVLSPDKKFLIADIYKGSVLEKDLALGDYIKSIDGEIISPVNLNTVLRRIQTKKVFKIVAYESYNSEYEFKEEIKLTKQLDVLLNKEKLFHLRPEPQKLIFTLSVIVQDEHASDDFTTLFSFPPEEKNLLHKLKGSFLTISSIMEQSFTAPKVSNVQVQGTTFYVHYAIRKNNKFIFMGFNSDFVKPFDVLLHSTNLLKFIDYVYPENMTVSNYQDLTIICELMKIRLLEQSSEVIDFEKLFSCSTFVPLPKEIVLRINDSLSELEAMDYRNWNEDLVELYGKFNVSGSCLFYKTNLICSHLNDAEMQNVELFLKQSCLKQLYQNCLFREIAIWQRVYPKDYQSFNMENDSEKNKNFLLVAANGNLMMCMILEENEFNLKLDVETQSSNYLIHFLEEMNDVLNHLRMVGIENLTRLWISSAKRPQCIDFKGKDEYVAQAYVEPILEEEEEEEDQKSDLESQFDSQKSSSAFEDSFYKDFTEIIPQTITFGRDKNVLYHFTQLDLKEGICITTLSDNDSNSKNSLLADVFRRGCIKIHRMFQNTIRFNLMLSKENTRISYKSTLSPIKEKALLIHLKVDKEVKALWIVGRLFGSQELFVCYDDAVPQNMVEIAFRIALNCIG